MFLILLINVLMAATFSVVKLVLDNYTGPLFLVGYRMTLAGFLLLGYLFFFKRKDLKIEKQDWLAFVKIILFHVYISYICEFWSQKYLSPSKVALLFNLSPFITAGFSYFMHKQTQSIKKLAGLVIGFVGFFPILLKHSPTEEAFGSFLNISQPELVLFIGVASAAYAWLIVEHLVVKRKYSALMVNGFGMLCGGLLATLTSFVVGNYGANFGLAGFGRAWNPVPFTDFGILTLWVLVLILFSNVIFYNVYAWLMHRYSPTLLSFFGLTIPLFAAGWEWLLLGGTVSWIFWLSLSIISFGLALYYREEMLENKAR
jgi:drug/metabolite transporter (DMT)-like permease